MDDLVDNLMAIVGRENVLSKPDELLVYECDGLPQHKHRPRAVVFPSSTEETSAVMRELARATYGQLLLGIVAAGLVAFALYSIADARFRKV